MQWVSSAAVGYVLAGRDAGRRSSPARCGGQRPRHRRPVIPSDHQIATPSSHPFEPGHRTAAWLAVSSIASHLRSARRASWRT